MSPHHTLTLNLESKTKTASEKRRRRKNGPYSFFEHCLHSKCDVLRAHFRQNGECVTFYDCTASACRVSFSVRGAALARLQFLCDKNKPNEWSERNSLNRCRMAWVIATLIWLVDRNTRQHFGDKCSLERVFALSFCGFPLFAITILWLSFWWCVCWAEK